MRRLAFLEFRLQWEGRVNRADLVDHFGISVPQASADLQLYQKFAGANMEYDKSTKAYVRTERFVPILSETGGAEHYLEQLRSVTTGLITSASSWVGYVPPTDLVHSLRRRADTNTVRALVDAIRQGRALHIRYASLTRPEPIWRWVSPHSLVHDGYRWHARAWCHERLAFLDFVIGRIMDFGAFEDAQGNPDADLAWHRRVTLRIEPHPALDPGNRRALEVDFGMVDGYTEVETRVCLVSYLERFLGLDLDQWDVEPKRQQIFLANREEVRAVQRELGADWK